MPFTFLPVTPANRPGSSGYGAWSGVPSSSNMDAAIAGKVDMPRYDLASGMLVSSLTGKPFSGRDPYSGKQYLSGKESPAAAAGGAGTPPAPTGTAADYAAINVPKNPELAAQLSELMKTFKTTADSALADFGTHLNEFKTDLAGARTAAADATNIAPTVSALQGAQKTYAQQLAESNAAYQQALKEGAARSRGVIAQEMDMLPSYDTAVNNVRNLALSRLGPQMAAYKLGSGNPTGASGAEMAYLSNAVANIAAPFELQKIQKGYDILGGQALPLEETLGGRNIAYAGSYLPGTAGSLYSSATNLANTVQSLKERTASMKLQDAIAFMQAQQVPLNVQSQVLGIEIGQLQQLASLYPSAYYQGLQYLPGAYGMSPQGFDMSLPGYPSFPTRIPGRGGYPTGNPSLGPNAPQTVPPGGVRPEGYTGPFDPNTPVGYPGYANPAYGGAGAVFGTGQNRLVKQADGSWYNPYSGQYVGGPTNRVNAPGAPLTAGPAASYNPRTGTVTNPGGASGLAGSYLTPQQVAAFEWNRNLTPQDEYNLAASIGGY